MIIKVLKKKKNKNLNLDFLIMIKKIINKLHQNKKIINKMKIINHKKL